ncbi:hypothetical protein FWC31_00175 [Candidatus Saccharibacteria bacterium]|nr:hypothetical protein [Candidatus Saccharibacteria bacterium]
MLSINTPPLSNENPELCSRCGGECCKHGGFAYAADDLALQDKNGNLTTEYLRELLDGGKIQISYMIYYNGLSSFIVEAAQSKEGVCKNLGEAGCNLAFDYRPAICRGFRPYPGGHINSLGKGEPCRIDQYEKDRVRFSWRPYQEMLSMLHEEKMTRIEYAVTAALEDLEGFLKYK